MLNNEVPVILSDRLESIIRELVDKYNDPIAVEILRVHKLCQERKTIAAQWFPEIVKYADAEIERSVSKEVQMLSVRISDADFEVSFLPGDKDPEYSSDGVWSRKNRQTGKPGKIFQKLLLAKFKQVEWEVFVNRFKAEKCCSIFELVEGEEIRFWYNDENYYECLGTLGNSCMRYAECSDYFDIYVENAKMLITKKNGKLTGRALVWTMPDGTILMDRIYTCYDYLKDCFIEYAKENQWWIRENNSMLSSGDDQWWRTPEDDYQECKSPEFTIKLPRRYNCYPYIDSFRYLNFDTLTLSTHCHDHWAYCDSTDGYTSEETCYICPNCGARYYGTHDECPDEMRWSDWADDYYCEDCCWWCELLEDYIPCNVETTTIYGDGYSDECPWEWATDNYVRTPDGNESSSDFVKVDGNFYYIDKLRWNEEAGKYERKYELQSNSN